MCGIAGVIDFTGNAVDHETLHRMADALQHRGPDEGQVFVDGPCGLAHRRLSIIDLEHSHQPMALPGDVLRGVYNGEVYNYLSLRRDLQRSGVPFATEGDTEVVLAAIAKRWIDALPQLDGMFALGAWRPREERLLLARDPIGIKPLYFARPRPGVLVFASEIKAVLEHPSVDRSLNVDGLRQAVRFRAVYGTDTLYRGVEQLEPGSWLEFDREGIQRGRYYDVSKEVADARSAHAQESEDELVRRGEQLLVDAVRKRLIADVPVGAFLSGGLDSSLIASLIRECRGPGEETRTFAVGFRGDPNSELPYAQDVADAIGTEHTAVEVTEDDYIDTLRSLTALRDAPLSEPADLAIAKMSAVARKTVKVVLSGEGADEVFGGYPKYGFATAPSWARVAVRTIGPERVTSLASVLGVEARRVRVASRALSERDEADRLVQWFSYLDREGTADLLPKMGWSDAEWEATSSYQREALAGLATEGPLTRMQGVDILTWLPGNLLERGDRMTMSAGLEARVPFLDKALVAYGLALDDRLKVRRRVGKRVVRQWAQTRLPMHIVERKKWGFRVPLAQWFRGRMKPMLNDYLLNPNGLCGIYGDRSQIVQLLEAHDSGDIDANLALWTLLSLEVWFQDVFSGGLPAGQAESLQG